MNVRNRDSRDFVDGVLVVRGLDVGDLLADIGLAVHID